MPSTQIPLAYRQDGHSFGAANRRRVLLRSYRDRKMNLRGDATENYFDSMTVIEASKPFARGPQVWALGVEAYHALGELGLIPEKTELLYGQVFHKMPKSPFHTYLLRMLLELLRAAVPEGFVVSTEQPITCADSEPEPDLSVVRGEIADFRRTHPTTAELVIEICVTTHEYDRSKLRAYAKAGVQECWLVLAPEKQIEVHRRPREGQFAERSVHGPGGSLTSAVVPFLTVELDRLFAA